MKRTISHLMISAALLSLGFLAAQATTASSKFKPAPRPGLAVLAQCATHFKKQNPGTHSYQCAFRFFPKCKAGNTVGDTKVVVAGYYRVVVYTCNEPPH